MREFTPHKKGNRILGWWLKNPHTGKITYLALRWHKDMFKGDEKTLSDAMRTGVACWGIDGDTLQLCRIKGVKLVGVSVRTEKKKDQGSVYLTRIENFFDPANGRLSSKGNSRFRYLPINKFKVIRRLNL